MDVGGNSETPQAGAPSPSCNAACLGAWARVLSTEKRLVSSSRDLGEGLKLGTALGL